MHTKALDVTRLLVDGRPYPLDRGTLTLSTDDEGVRTWEIEARPGEYHEVEDRSDDRPHEIGVEAGGRSFSGSAWLANDMTRSDRLSDDPPSTLVRQWHRLLGTGHLDGFEEDEPW